MESFGYIPSSDVAGSSRRSPFRFLSIFHTDFYSDCTSLPSISSELLSLFYKPLLAFVMSCFLDEIKNGFQYSTSSCSVWPTQFEDVSPKVYCWIFCKK